MTLEQRQEEHVGVRGGAFKAERTASAKALRRGEGGLLEKLQGQAGDPAQEGGRLCCPKWLWLSHWVRWEPLGGLKQKGKILRFTLEQGVGLLC